MKKTIYLLLSFILALNAIIFFSQEQTSEYYFIQEAVTFATIIPIVIALTVPFVAAWLIYNFKNKKNKI